MVIAKKLEVGADSLHNRGDKDALRFDKEYHSSLLKI
jgi:hypothetical protein